MAILYVPRAFGSTLILVVSVPGIAIISDALRGVATISDVSIGQVILSDQA